jgi:hypothetical protein
MARLAISDDGHDLDHSPSPPRNADDHVVALATSLSHCLRSLSFTFSCSVIGECPVGCKTAGQGRGPGNVDVLFFVAASGNDHYLRTPDGWNRR